MSHRIKMELKQTAKPELKECVRNLRRALEAFGPVTAMVMLHLDCDVTELQALGKVSNEAHRYTSPSITLVEDLGDGKERALTFFARWVKHK